MKNIFKIILKHYLRVITKIVLVIHRPIVIAIAGSTNKNFVKQEIKSCIENMGFSVRANPKNFNTEIGLPLSILYLPSGYNEYKKWLPAIFRAPLTIFQRNFPKFLVLGLGTSDQGDMDYLLSIVRPDISVITEITQRYREGFSDMNSLVEEYETLASKTKKNGFLVLNADNYRIKNISENKKQKVIFYGFSDISDFKIVEIKKTKTGQGISIKKDGKIKLYQLKRFGNHHVYAFTAMLAVNSILKK